MIFAIKDERYYEDRIEYVDDDKNSMLYGKALVFDKASRIIRTREGGMTVSSPLFGDTCEFMFGRGWETRVDGGDAGGPASEHTAGAPAESKPLRPIGDIGLPCGKCVLKHLQAFLAYALNTPGQTMPAYTLPAPSRSCRALSQALVAWVEKCEGYAYHKMYVIGCLVRAEDAVVSAGGPEDRIKGIREIRIGLESGGISDPTQPLIGLGASYAIGHLEEARRECPEEYVSMLREITDAVYKDGVFANEYMPKVAEAIDAIALTIYGQEIYVKKQTGENPEKGGECDMACKKGKCAAAKGGKTVAPAKAAKTACKGGKAKK